MARIYLASSWRNERQPEIVNLLRDAVDHKLSTYLKASLSHVRL